MQENLNVQEIAENSEALSNIIELLQTCKFRKWPLFDAYFGENALSQEGSRVLY